MAPCSAGVKGGMACGDAGGNDWTGELRSGLCVTAGCCTADPATVPSVRASKGLGFGG